MKTAEPEIPRFNLERIFKLRNKLMTDKMFGVPGAVIDAVYFSSLGSSLARLLRVEPATIVESMRYLLGKELTHKGSFDLCWRLAANLPILKEGKAVLPWTKQSEPEWAPVQVASSHWHLRSNSRGKRSGHMLRLQFLAGSACPERITVFWTKEFQGYMSRELGFTHAQGRYPRRDGAELTQLRLMVLLEPEKSGQYPGFERISVTSAMRTHNRMVMAKRGRIKFACPRSYTHPCHSCHVGYKECQAATHPYSYASRTCTGCSQVNWHDADPERPRRYCLLCYNKSERGDKPTKVTT